MGGDDDPNNLVVLTPEEHFVAHQLLAKIHPTETGLIFALQGMCSWNSTQSRSNKAYGWLRRKFSENMKLRWTDPQYRYMQSAINRERSQSDAFRSRIAESNKASWTEERRAAHSKLSKQLWQDPEYKANIVSKTRRKGPLSTETKKRISEAMKRRRDLKSEEKKNEDIVSDNYGAVID